MKAGEPGPGPWSWREDLARSVREQEIRRQILYNSTRKAGTRLFLASRVRAGMPAMLPEFIKTLCGAVIGFWIVTALLTHFFHAKPLYALSALGLLYSLQSAFHGYKLATDPSYTIPKCGCAGAGKDASELVLRSKQSAILRVPNSVLGATLYLILLMLVYQGHHGAATLTAVLAVLASAYLAYVMVAKLAALCSNCINVAALNLLILWEVLR